MQTGTFKHPRIAVLGLMLESNRFAPVVHRSDFEDRVLVWGDEMEDELHASRSRLPAELRAFCAASRIAGADIIPVGFGLVEAGGPVQHTFFSDAVTRMCDGLSKVAPDAVYICNHGAMRTTESNDPDGDMFAAIRRQVGPNIPIIATLDLHANVSSRMVRSVDMIVGYRTNPHVDMSQRGDEAAHTLQRILSGAISPTSDLIRLPIVPPTVTLLTESGPFAELTQAAESLRPEALNISLFGGFAYADTPKNGLSILVTTDDDTAEARRLANCLASAAWGDRQRYRPQLTSLDDAIAKAVDAGTDPSLPPVALADVADNPGGGGTGATTWIMSQLVAAHAAGAYVGLINAPDVAKAAHDAGEGKTFHASFTDHDAPDYSRPFSHAATVEKLSDGNCIGRRGFYADRHMHLGPTALIDIAGVKVVVISVRTQCADPVFFEMLGIDLRQVRSLTVKSRGHFRAGFDEFFGPEQIVEVDAPGLSSPVLSRFEFREVPRPCIPLDHEAEWQPVANFVR